MANLKLFLLLTLGGVIVTTLTIVAVFIIINVCIQRKAAEVRKRAEQNNYMNGTNTQRTHGDAEPPPLPSRDQFLSEESDGNSYEDIDASPDFKKNSKSLQQTPYFHSPYTSANYQDKMSTSENYDNVDQLDHIVPKSYEDLRSLPDYVDLEDGTPMVSLQPLSLAVHTQCQDSQSISDNYDDVGAFDSSSEDYDDVG